MFNIFTESLPQACRLVVQPVDFFPPVLGSGLLLHGIGRLAATCRFFGARRGSVLWKQPLGLSLCEAVLRRH